MDNKLISVILVMLGASIQIGSSNCFMTACGNTHHPILWVIGMITGACVMFVGIQMRDGRSFRNLFKQGE
jgi:fructose-specific phosphotransferase system IIC component